MDEELVAQLHGAAVGHGVIRIGRADEVRAGYARLIALAEKKKRGVRFLPRQALKRVYRAASKTGCINPFASN